MTWKSELVVFKKIMKWKSLIFLDREKSSNFTILLIQSALTVALEPVLRKFIEQYSHYFHTVMGGLLESWDGFADVKNGIHTLPIWLLTGEK